MVGVRHRFHGYNSLRGVYQHGRGLRTQHVTLKYIHRDPRRPYRVAVVVSRKVSKSAVTRNRIRRRVFEIVRQSNVTPGTDLVFTIYDEKVAELAAPKLKKAVQELIEKTAQADPKA